jgi:serine/threonine protein kinase
MQMAANGAVSDHFRDKKLADPTRQARIICDIVLGMRYIHFCDIIHRDLKPANILLDENWRGLIGDFGLSRAVSADSPASSGRGTPAYAAPEQLNPTGPYNSKVDVFAFGWVAYEIMSFPWPVGRCAQSELSHPPPRFGSVMPGLIQRCWSVDPSQRPSFREILDEFESNGWAILPDADARVVEAAVSQVIALEEPLMS